MNLLLIIFNNFRFKRAIQSGIISKWKQVCWNGNFRKIKVIINKNKSNQDTLKLNHLSSTFYILLSCLLISLTTLLIELFIKIYYS